MYTKIFTHYDNLKSFVFMKKMYKYKDFRYAHGNIPKGLVFVT